MEAARFYVPESNRNIVPKDSSKDPMTCLPAGLRGHIANGHLNPVALAWIGVARYDIELAEFRKIPLDWVVGKAYDRLEEDIALARSKLEESYLSYVAIGELGLPRLFELRGWDYWDTGLHKTMIVKNLLYIEQTKRVQVDWARVARFVPNLEGTTLTIERDTTDRTFTLPLNYMIEQMRVGLAAVPFAAI